MIVRVVKIKCISGMEDQLSQMGRTQLVTINREAGCKEVYFGEPIDGDNQSNFGVISIWRDKEVLNALKINDKYRKLQNDMSAFIESVIEEVYVIPYGDKNYTLTQAGN